MCRLVHTGDHGIHYCFIEGKIIFTLVSLLVSFAKDEFQYVLMGGNLKQTAVINIVRLRILIEFNVSYAQQHTFSKVAVTNFENYL